MQLRDCRAIVTGGANGIGRALCHGLAAAGAAQVVVTDLDGAGAETVAGEIGGIASALDVRDGAALAALVDRIEADHGPVDLFCSNAGIATGFDSYDNAAAPDDAVWQAAWEVNVLAHVRAARVLLPRMVARGRGHFLQTISAAGLLNQIGSAVYATTKHAAVGFAENLAITHRDAGIGVSILCPQGVETGMLRSLSQGPQHEDVMSAEDVAQAALNSVEAGEFLCLPHPQVLGYIQGKTGNYGRWIGGMAKIQRRILADRAGG